MSTDPWSGNGQPEARPAVVRWESALAGLLAAFCFAAFLILPVLGPLALPFAGVPVVRVTHRHGLAAGLVAAAVCSGILLVLGAAAGGIAEGVAGTLFSLLLTALPAAATAWGRRGGSASAAYLILCAAGFALLGGGLLVRAQLTPRSFDKEVAAAFDEMGPAAVTRAQLDPETAARMRATLAAARDFAATFWIGLVGASWVLGSAVAFYVGSRLARPAASAEAARFEALRIPPAVVAAFAAAGAGSVFLSGMPRRIAGDLLIPLLALYFVAGLSIICHFARKWFRVRILRVGLYALIVYFPINVGVILLGLFDWYADFRRRGEGALEKR